MNDRNFGRDLDHWLTSDPRDEPDGSEEATMPEDPGENLVASLVQTSYNQYANSSQRLIESYRDDATRQRAEKELIRAGIERLLNGPYAPSETSIRTALYPDDAVIEARAKELLNPDF
jgi:hypothetical protein